ncbi:rhodanese-like domain-containing protein [Nonomuraea sp. B12E4]|uniref:rhodanese-like domain-containing protein n=1 Tax=Nonomuraea sp. B12E4 TaxID=3153564 RepID=UPI00325E7841
MSSVLSPPPASPEQAIAHFAAKLAYETDVSDVHTDLEAGTPGPVVAITYCWGPGCNGATRAALEFARLGYQVKEMIGGYEYGVREGFLARIVNGLRPRQVDDLTAVPTGVACGC